MVEELTQNRPSSDETSRLLPRGQLSPDLEGLSGADIANEGLEYVVENTGIALVENALSGGTSQGNEATEGESDEARWLRESKLNHSGMAWYRRPSLPLLCFAVGLLSLSETMVVSPTIILTTRKICQGLAAEASVGDERPNCDMSQAQSRYSAIQSVQMLVQGIVSTVLAGKLGELSDRFGRKPIFQYTGFIKLASILAIGYTVLPSTPYSKWKIIVANSSQALSGGLMLTIANGNSYISDCTEPKERTVAISMLMSTIYAGIGLGPLVGSTVVKLSDGNNYLPFIIALCLVFAFITFSTLFMTESRHAHALQHSQTKFRNRRRSFESVLSNTSSNPVNNHGKYHMLKLLDLLSPVKKLWLPPTAHNSLVARYTVLTLVALDVLFMVSTAAMIVPLVLYSTYQFHWGSVKLGYFISFVGIGRAIVLLALSPLFLVLLKKRYARLDNSIDSVDLISLRLGMLSVIVSIAVTYIWDEQRGVSLLIFALFQDLSAIFSPTLQATVVKYCSKSSLGEVFGAIALVRSASMLVFPPILLAIYAKTVATRPKLFMIIPLCASIVAFGLTFLLRIVTDPELLRRPSQASLRASDPSDPTSKGSQDRRASTAKQLRVPTSQ